MSTVKKHRIVIIGEGGVGKSAVTIQFVQNNFIVEYDPTIEDSYRKQVEVDDEVCILDLLDTAGQEEFSTMRDQYMRTGDGFILVYSITSRNSFDCIPGLRDQILRATDSSEVPMVLIGNKSDLEPDREVTKTEGEELARTLKCKFMETSALNRTNIDECFFEVVREIRRKEGGGGGGGGTAGKGGDKKKKERGRCLIL